MAVFATACSIYDESLSRAGPRDAEADALVLPDVEEVVDASVADEDEAAVPADEASQDADATSSIGDAGLDVVETGGADIDVARSRPTAISLVGAPSPSGQQAPTTSGSAFTQACATNEVIIGYTGTTDAPDASLIVLRTFRAVCATLSVTGTGSYAVATKSAETLPPVGTKPGPIPQIQMCGNDQIVVGFAGRSGSDIDQIAIVCGSFAISEAGGGFAISIGNETMHPGLGGQGGNPFAALHCPDGMVAVGDEGRAAYTINAFGLLCATPTLVVQ